MTPDQAREEVRALAAKVEEAEDPRSAVQLVRDRINELTKLGEDIPEELTWIEKRLVAECIDASQGR